MKYEELIDNYFAGKLSSKEAENLLKEVEKNPALKEEFDFQKELTNSVGEVRKAELKASLKALPTPSLFSNSTVYYGAAAFIGVLLLGLGAFYLNTDENKQRVAIENEVFTDEINTEQIIKEEATHVMTEEISEPETQTQTEPNVADRKPNSEIKNNTPENTVIANTRPETKVSTGNKTPSVNTIEEKNKTQTDIKYDIQEPSVNPAIAEMNSVHDETDINAPSDNLTINSKESKVSEIVPKIEANNKSYRKYQYDGQNLTLIGDYNSSVPYVLYELKAGSGKQLYLKFESQYFEIKNTGSKTSRLEPLSDTVIINELENK